MLNSFARAVSLGTAIILCAKYGLFLLNNKRMHGLMHRLKDLVIQFNFGLLQKVLHQIKALITLISKIFEPVFYINCSVFYYCLL